LGNKGIGLRMIHRDPAIEMAKIPQMNGQEGRAGGDYP